MKIIILDFTDGKVKIINNISENLQIEEIEDILIDKYNLKLSNIQFMIVPELEIETLN
ncbi:MAG: hypothetical protein PHI37_02160 [Candidatus Gracilibacteria bacterium]|nr:hypothetical protein [Candidatus Gracilibacteria bacterium]